MRSKRVAPSKRDKRASEGLGIEHRGRNPRKFDEEKVIFIGKHGHCERKTIRKIQEIPGDDLWFEIISYKPGEFSIKEWMDLPYFCKRAIWASRNDPKYKDRVLDFHLGRLKKQRKRKIWRKNRHE